jgi:hypothetical protein
MYTSFFALLPGLPAKCKMKLSASAVAGNVRKVVFTDAAFLAPNVITKIFPEKIINVTVPEGFAITIFCEQLA